MEGDQLRRKERGWVYKEREMDIQGAAGKVFSHSLGEEFGSCRDRQPTVTLWEEGFGRLADLGEECQLVRKGAQRQVK